MTYHLRIENALKSRGIFHDFAPGNLATKEGKLSLIDLDAYRSFSLIFKKEKESFEKFDLDVWWKPYEFAFNDVTLKLPVMISDLLQIDRPIISSEKCIQKIINNLAK
jgi:hypothetical protein